MRPTDNSLSDDYILDAVSLQAGIPQEYLAPAGFSRLIDLMDTEAGALLVGQEAAIARLATVLTAQANERFLAWQGGDLQLPSDQRRPLAAILACGPTGVGKSQTAKILAQTLYQGRLITLNGSDVSMEQRHGVATWVGAPPGYVGYNQGGTLTNGLRQHKTCVVLVDEVEKASSEVMRDVLLPLLGEGVVVDRSTGEDLYATECVIFATSNEAPRRARQLGFGGASRGETEALVLSPEVLARFNAVVEYRALSDQDKWQVWERQLSDWLERGGHGHSIAFDEAAQHWLREQIDNAPGGARGVIDLFRQTMVPLLLALPSGWTTMTLRDGILSWVE